MVHVGHWCSTCQVTPHSSYNCCCIIGSTFEFRSQSNWTSAYCNTTLIDIHPCSDALQATPDHSTPYPVNTLMSAPEDQTGEQDQLYAHLDPVPLTPPADCIPLTEDGGVLKHVVAEGKGDLPVRHGRCLGELIQALLHKIFVLLATICILTNRQVLCQRVTCSCCCCMYCSALHRTLHT
jgi:hypothetical protein